jgi:hypothetical protein
LFAVDFFLGKKVDFAGCFGRAGILEIFEVECHVTGVVVDLFEIALDDGVFIGINGCAESGEGSGSQKLGRRRCYGLIGLSKWIVLRK